MWEKKWLLLISCISAAAVAGSNVSNPPAKQVGSVKIQFDMRRIVTPLLITKANNPPTWRAYLPACPPTTEYVSGVNPMLLELDQPPNYSYCQCICQGQCSNLPGVTSTGGRLPLYTATTTCATQAQGLLSTTFFTGNPTPPHQYYYCQAGNCTTNPLPAEFNISVPTGGYNNTVKIDFLACNIVAITGCGAPDISAVGKQTAF